MTAAPRDSGSAAGLWRSRGYGWRLDVRPDGAFDFLDHTDVGDRLAERCGPGAFDQAYEDVRTDGPTTLSLRQRGDVTTYWFDRPPGGQATAKAAPDSGDARLNFDVLWKIFDQHYAFFDLRGVDWRASRALRGRLDEGSGEDELFGLCGELLAPLKDAHVGLDAGGRFLDVTSPVRQRKLEVQAAFGVPPWAVDRDTYARGVGAGLAGLFLPQGRRTAGNGVLVYGQTAPGVGYVAILGEFGWADTARARAAQDLPRPRLEAASFLADEVAAMDAALEEVVAAFRDMKAVIVDARLNFGGYDRLALEFAGAFADRKRVAYRKKAWTSAGFAAHQEICVNPRARTLAHVPTYLLTGRQTASAGEILVLGMMACPSVTRVGEATLGILSDNLYKRLPNGWEVSLSNEVYEAPDGALYEGSGIPPQIECPVHDPADVKGGLRVAVDTALKRIDAP